MTGVQTCALPIYLLRIVALCCTCVLIYELNITLENQLFVKTNAYANYRIINNQETKILQINGYTFNRTDVDEVDLKNKQTDKYMGLVAQELIEVIPEVISKDNKDMYSVSYSNIVALLVEALKEEISKRKELETRISLMEIKLAI